MYTILFGDDGILGLLEVINKKNDFILEITKWFCIDEDLLFLLFIRNAFTGDQHKQR